MQASRGFFRKRSGLALGCVQQAVDQRNSQKVRFSGWLNKGIVRCHASTTSVKVLGIVYQPADLE